MSASIEIKGLKQLRDKLMALGGVASVKVLTSAARKSMKIVAEEARTLCPEDTGALKKSIRLAAVKPRRGTVVASVGIVVTARKVREEIPIPEVGMVSVSEKIDASWRWHFTEFGTSHSSAKPFLRPAFDKHKEAVIAECKDVLSKAINRAVRQAARKAAKGGNS